jgi:dihydrolipoamide dehydrogenase
MKYDLTVIGAGPGGYVAAIKAAQHGMKTAIIENQELGGTCLNKGCVPTKTIMHSSHLFYETKNFENLGIFLSEIHYDMNKIMDRKEEVVDKIRGGIYQLLKENGVTIITGTATIQDSKHIQIQPVDLILETDKILIATGSKPYLPPVEGIGLQDVVTSDELLSVRDKTYHKLLIIGGGVIGVEFATIYQELGHQVEIIEAMDRILPNMDKEISQSVAMNLKKKGVVIHTKSKVLCMVENPDRDEHKLLCEYEESDGEKKTAVSDGILISIGRKANTDGLFAGDFQLEMNRDKIMVNDSFETSIKDVYAIGDVIGGIQLAHAALAQGIFAVERMLGLTPSIHLDVVPSCIYTSPEVAAVGLTEAEAKERGYSVKTGKYPMLGNCKTVLSMDERGYIKIISDEITGKVIGAQLVCARATDMISEIATAIAHGLTARDLASVIRPHPTYAEGITETAEDIFGMAIHLAPRKGRNK